MAGKTYPLTVKDIDHLASLARLFISKNEYKKYIRQLSESLIYVENLSDISTDFISEANYVTNATNVYREDKYSSDRMLKLKEALRNAKRTKGDFFVVKRIL